MRKSKDPTYLRLELVRYAKEHGVKPAARREINFRSFPPKADRYRLRKFGQIRCRQLREQFKMTVNLKGDGHLPLR